MGRNDGSGAQRRSTLSAARAAIGDRRHRDHPSDTRRHRAPGARLRAAVAVIVAPALMGTLFIYAVTANAATASATPASSVLVFTTQPANTTGGTAFGSTVVTVEDGSGNTVTTSGVTVTLTLTSANGATLTCPAQAAAQGVATFNGCSVDKAGTYTLTAAATGVTSATSKSFTVAVGAPAKLVYTQQPLGVTAGASFAKAPTVAIEDAGGNVVTSSSDRVFLTIVTGTTTGIPATSSADLVCGDPSETPHVITSTTTPPGPSQTVYQVNAVNGIASFPDCDISAPATVPYRLGAVAVDGDQNNQTSIPINSDPFTVIGTASKIGFTTQPSGAISGSVFTTQPVVTIEDSAGNPVALPAGATSEPITLTITPNTGTVGAALACTSAVAATGAPEASAAFTGCALDRSGTYTLTASSPDYGTTTSNSLSVTPKGPSSLSFSTSPSGTITGGTAFGVQPVVTSADDSGNPVSDSVTLGIQAAGGGATTAQLTCPSTTVQAGTGSAAFTGCSVDKAGSYQLVATDPSGHKGYSSAFTVSVGAASQLGFTSQPAAAGPSLTPQPTVAVEDAGGNPVTSATGTINLSVLAGTGTAGAQVTCTNDPVTLVNGSASFSGCGLSRAGSGYELIATGDNMSVTSAAFNASSGTPTKLAFVTQPAGATVAAPFSSQPRVVVEDASGNPVGPTGTPVNLALSGGSGTLNCATDPVTATTGTANFASCAVSTAGTYSLVATAPGLASATSSAFSVTAASALGVVPVSLPPAQTVGGQTYSRDGTTVDDDVNTVTGALQLSLTDLKVAGIGEPLSLVRSYNSADTTGGLFGPGWSSVFDAGVTVAPGAKTATVRGEDGQQLVFTSNGSGGWVAPAGGRATLTCSGPTCTVTTFGGVSWQSVGGKIQNYLAPTGQGLHFTYANGQLTGLTVQTSSGPLAVSVTLTNGRITMVSTPTRSVSYAYSPSGLLTGYTDANNNTWTYSYSGGGLAQELDPSNRSRLQVSYSGGRVASAASLGSSHGFSDTWTWSGGTGTRAAQVEANGTLTTGDYLYHSVNNGLVSEQFPDGALTQYSYDNNLDLVATENPNGALQTMTYSPSGDMISQSEPYSSAANAVAVNRYTYSASHQLTSATDPNGYTTTYTYSGANLITTTPPGAASGATHYLYNKWGEQTEKDTPTGIETFSYDAAGNQTGFQYLDLHRSTLNGLGPLTVYDEAGDKLTAVDARGHNSNGSMNRSYETTYAYDSDGNLLSTTTPGNQTTSTTYNAAGDVTSSTSPTGTTTSYSWDPATLTSTAKVGSTVTSTSVYDPSGDVLSQTNAGNQVTSYTYDTTGRQITKTDTANVTTTMTYNLQGDVVATSDTTGHSGTYVYDPLNRVVSSTYDGATTTTAYDPDGNVVSQSDAAGHPTTYTYTGHDKVASVTNGAGTTRYTYDLSDNMISSTDGNGHLTYYTYNGAGQKTAMTVNGHTWRYSYDPANNLVSTTDPDGRTTTYTVNAQDLRTNTSYSQNSSGFSVSETYNGAGQRLSMTDPTGTHNYQYDSNGNLVAADNPGGQGNFTYNYSTPGAMTEQYPDGTNVTYTYDDAHNVMSVASTVSGQSSPNVDVSYVRNTSRQVTGIAYSNGIVETQNYDAAGQLTNQTLACATTTEATTNYSYDSAGNPLGVAATVGSTTATTGYGYDPSGRLAAQTSGTAAASPTLPTAGCTSGTQQQPGSPQQNEANDTSGTTTGSAPPTTANQPAGGAGGAAAPTTAATANPISYDHTGNQLSNGAGTTYTYNAGDEITSASNGSTYTYDNSGNLTSAKTRSGTTAYTYDAADHLVKVVTPTTTVTYTYDGDGNRVSQTVGSTTTNYSWDISTQTPVLALERTSGGALIRRYIYGVGPVALQTPSGTFYYHTDASGDVSEISDATGAVVETYRYGGFGQVTTTNLASDAPANPLLFQGQYLDSNTGLYDMGARNYDPATGRFTQRDPSATPVGTATVSPYVYAQDEPTALSDPTGNAPSSALSDPSSSNILSPSGIEGEVKHFAEGHSTETADIVADVKLAALPIVKAVTMKAIVAIGKSQGYIEEMAVKGAVSDSEAAVGKIGGKVFGVAGLALGAYVTVEDCEYGSTAQCVGDVVGLAIAVGCLAISDGGASILCSLAGAAISMLIVQYFPQIVEGLTDFAGYITDGATIAFNALAQGFEAAGAALDAAFTQVGDELASGFTDAGTAIVTGFNDAIGAVATGFNKLASAVSSGFNSAVNTLEQAGLTAVQMASVLYNTFTEALPAVLDELNNMAYDVDGVAKAVGQVFSQTYSEVAATLQQFGYSVIQLGTALETDFSNAINAAYGAVDAGVTAVLEGLNYAVTDLTQVLSTVFAEGDAIAAGVLAGLNFGATAVADGIASVYNLGASAVAGVISGLKNSLSDAYYTAGQVAGAIGSAFSSAISQAGVAVDQYVAQAMQAANLGVTYVADALNTAFGDADQAVADALAYAGYAVSDIVSGLENTFNDGAQQIASLFNNISGFVTQYGDAIKNALEQAFNIGDSALEGILSAANWASSAIQSLGGDFESFGQDLEQGWDDFTSLF